jgi:hypothetical protein
MVSGHPAVLHHRALERYHFASRQKRLHEKVEGLVSRLDAMEEKINKK